MSKEKKQITKKEVRKIAGLANIDIEESELEKYSKWISDILEYVDMLSEVDTGDSEFKTQVDLKNVLRKDKVKPGLTQKQALSNRKKQLKNGNIVIKAVLGGKQ